MLAVRQAKAEDMDQARQLLGRACAFSVDGGHLSDMVRGCDVFELLDGGQVVGAFAAEVTTHDSGRTIVITAAGGLPGYDLAGAMAAWAERQARGTVQANGLTCTTKRRGLVRRLQKEGFRVAGYVLRKELIHGQ